MIYNTLLFLAGCVFVWFGVKALLISSEMISERKSNYRAGTHDYYGNKIEED